MEPSGTVTFLFTDIEGSTRLVQQHREGWNEIQKRHHDILRAAIDAHAGYVFQVVGDAFCAAFSTAGEAVLAAVRIQVDLNDETWLEHAVIKVRAGIHTGTAMIQPDGQYQGYLAMSRAQRLLSSAHGGQVLVSLASQELVRDHLPEGVRLRDMGAHRLKDIAQPERIYQLVIPGLAADFPPIKTLERTGSHPASRLTVRLLGTFEIRLEEKPVSLAGRIAQSLFCYLILHAGVPHRREKLAGMFWPDVPEAKARTNLRYELWSIRKSLPVGDKRAFLITDDVAVSFNPSADYWLDVMALESVKESTSAENLMDALALYRGDFLPGFYDEWIMLEREHLQAVYEKRMAQLLALLEEEHRWKDILEWAERWISLGQGPEAAYRALMLAYDGLGEPGKVAATYRQCVDALREQNLEPSEQTRTLAFKRTSRLNIPVPLTSFIGREKELDAVAKLFSGSRLVTLTGSGGVGKTRLAIQVVAEVLDSFPDGVWFLDLAPVMDPSLVPNTLAGVLNLQPISGRDVTYTDLITGYLRSRQALIIFDNCEHLIDACAGLVHSLLTSCEHLSILATSREPLRVSGEVPYRVPSLGLPELNIESLVESLKKTESVRLFLERASMAEARCALGPQNALTVAEICRRLDGIPLAIELAAARVHVLGVDQILRRLDDRFNLLKAGSRSALPRHQTLRAAIEWSYDLLSEKERLLFRRLAVFIGGWTLEAAEAVCSGAGIEASEILDLLTQLVDKSLVLVDNRQAETRYRRLETIRQYANEKLDSSGERDALRDRHLKFFLELAETAEPHLIRSEQIEWLPLLDADYKNIRQAFEWSLEKSKAEQSLNICRALGMFCEIRCYWQEGLDWLTRALAKSIGGASKEERVACERAWYTRAMFELQLGYIKQAQASAEESLALLSEYSEERDIVIANCLLAKALIMQKGMDSEALSLMKKCHMRFHELDEPYWQAASFEMLIGILVAEGEIDFQKGHLHQIELARKAGERLLLADALSGYAEWLLNMDQADEACKYAEESDRLYKLIGSENTSQTSALFAEIAWINGDIQKAKSLFAELYERFSILGEKGYRSLYAGKLGLLAMEERDFPSARTYLEEARRAVREAGWKHVEAYYLIELSNLFYLQGYIPHFKQSVRESFSLRHHFRNYHKLNILMAMLGSFNLQKPENAARLLGLIENQNRVLSYSVSPIEKRYYIRAEAHAREVLGDIGFKSAIAEGHKMSLDAGLDLAWKTVDEL